MPDEDVIKFRILEDGSVKFDSSQVAGTESEILEMLKRIAVATGGSEDALTVEGHAPDHSHVHTGQHQHVGRG